ncbi:acyltransferase [Massilia sp. R2A-15]|uniref:acyltransferase family protein n=1 Tax=Massilia sp. R2A-15 TaxID=3064278 RepID=UPI0027351C37|nr:acyltransferase [Massilia sp. R2A-15]WLI88276.1 acyltransferase [Massilia sp. R2A-15]
MTTPGRFHALDALRGVAALSVVLWHWQHFFAPLNPRGAAFAIERQPLFDLFAFFYRHGHTAVQLFFCLSGFIFFWLYADPVARGGISFGRFAVLRMSRLYPLHLATLLVVAALQPLYLGLTGHYFVYPANDAYHFLLNLGFISAWGMEKGFSFNAPIWSVSVEVLMYGAFFLFCRRAGRHTGAMAAAVLAGWLLQKWNGPIGAGMMFFFLGGIAFSAYTRAVKSGGAWLLACTPVAWVFAVWSGRFETFSVIVFPMTVLALALLESRHQGLGRRWSWLGDISYSSYLLHFPLQLAAATLTAKLAIAQDVFYSPWCLLLFFATLLALSMASHHGFEIPVQRTLRRRFAPSRSGQGVPG